MISRNWLRSNSLISFAVTLQATWLGVLFDVHGLWNVVGKGNSHCFQSKIALQIKDDLPPTSLRGEASFTPFSDNTHQIYKITVSPAASWCLSCRNNKNTHPTWDFSQRYSIWTLFSFFWRHLRLIRLPDRHRSIFLGSEKDGEFEASHDQRFLMAWLGQRPMVERQGLCACTCSYVINTWPRFFVNYLM